MAFLSTKVVVEALVEKYERDGASGRLQRFQRFQRFTLMFSTLDFDPLEDPSFFGEAGLLRIAELVVGEICKGFGEPRSALRFARVRPRRGGSQIVLAGEGCGAGGECAGGVFPGGGGAEGGSGGEDGP